MRCLQPVRVLKPYEVTELSNSLIPFTRWAAMAINNNPYRHIMCNYGTTPDRKVDISAVLQVLGIR